LLRLKDAGGATGVAVRRGNDRVCNPLLEPSCRDTEILFALWYTSTFSAVCEEITMPRASTIFRPADVPESNASSYPEPFREGQRRLQPVPR
jgi:hypothetical protein